MRPETTYPRQTNITSLAATVVVSAFVIWLAFFTTQHGSIYARTPRTPAAASNLTATRSGAGAALAADQRPAHGQE